VLGNQLGDRQPIIRLNAANTPSGALTFVHPVGLWMIGKGARRIATGSKKIRRRVLTQARAFGGRAMSYAYNVASASIFQFISKKCR